MGGMTYRREYGFARLDEMVDGGPFFVNGVACHFHLGQFQYMKGVQGPAVQKPINTNPRLNPTQASIFLLKKVIL